MAEVKEPLEYLSEVQDLVDLNDFMQDEDFGNALELALKCIAKPNLPPAHAKTAMIQLEAYAFKFKMMGQVFMTIKKGRAGTEENNKKNVYYSISDACHELALDMKVMSREVAF